MVRLNGYVNHYNELGGAQAHVGSYSGVAVEDVVLDASGQMNLRAFQGSGQLLYRVYGHDAWHVRTSQPVGGSPQADGFWPIMHSGQVLNAIVVNGGGGPTTLQSAYEAGRTVFIVDENLDLTSADDKFRLASHGTVPEITFSGQFGFPVPGTQAAGDVALLRHSQGDSELTTLPTSDAEVAARSLGHASMMYNSGSGQVNMLPGSGFIQFRGQDSSVSTSPGTTFTIQGMFTGVDIDDEIFDAQEQNGFSPVDTVTVLVPGTYLCGYSITLNRTGTDTTRTIVQTYLKKNGSIMRGSRSHQLNRQGNFGRGQSRNIFVFEADAGDELEFEATRVVGPATLPTDLTIVIDKCQCWFWRIGPKRTMIDAKR